MKSKKRVALIGGAGFIGHNLAVALKEEGHDVHVIDSLNVNNLLAFYPTDKETLNRDLYLKMITQRLDLLREHDVPLYVQDARDYHQLSHVLDRIDPHVIVQLAAVAHADRSNKDPYSTFDHSLRTLENALDFARVRAEHFVYFSSSMVYGNFTADHVTEETPCNPLGIYGALKYSGEKIVIAYNQVFDLPYTIVRPSALYGERCVSRRVGQVFVENAINGGDIRVKGDGSDRLDFTYIADLVHGISCVINNENAKNEIFNLTYGESRSIGELAQVMIDHFPDLTVMYEPKDKLTPSRGTLSVHKARERIGYAPQHALDTGFQKYIAWYKSVLGRSRADLVGAAI
jgi:nucleoside-diphosphate-sugar epimerase